MEIDYLWAAIDVLEHAQTEKEKRSATRHLAGLVRKARELTPRQAESPAAFIEKTGPQARGRNANAERDALILKAYDALWTRRKHFTEPITSAAQVYRFLEQVGFPVSSPIQDRAYSDLAARRLDGEALQVALAAIPRSTQTYLSAERIKGIVRRRKTPS
ncbi:MAG: hypothetical protein WKH97_12330 [Casimicrobiaceae bacterium]